VNLEDGSGVDTITVPSFEERSSRLQAISPDGTTMIRRYVPFVSRPHVAFHPFRGFVRGESDEYRIDVAWHDGRVLRIEMEAEPIAVSSAAKAKIERELTTALRRTDPRWTWEGPRIGDYRPYFLGIEAASDGTIWVRRSLVAEERIEPAWYMSSSETERPEAYDVFDVDGTFCGRVTLPPEVRAVHLGGRFIWGVFEDAVGIPYVVKYMVATAAERSEISSECWV
jgi:hypothetical protein